MKLKPGSRIDRYVVEECVGQGGFGEVYRAMDPVLNRSVAIKVLREAIAASGASDQLGRSLREARAASALNHPSILTIHDAGEHDGEPYIIMEWIDGRTLRSLLTDGPLPVEKVALLGRQLAAALQRAHEARIAHRDLKPDNIMVRPDDVVKILDFGLARQWTADSVTAAATITGTMAGTLPYMAPEQLRGEQPDAASDLFALGIILYESVTGTHPFKAATSFATAQRILHDDPVPPGSIVALAAGWDDLLLKLLNKEPVARQAGVETIDKIFGAAGNGSEAMVRLKAERAQRTVHMVGRAGELTDLHRQWQAAAAGNGGFVMVTGEPGAGKTTLVQGFIDSLATQGKALLATGRCSERLGSGEPYLPFLEALGELCGSPQGALLRAVIKSKAPSWFMQLFPVTYSDSTADSIGKNLVGGSQERMRRELVDAFEEISKSYVMCILLEDLHWCDLATTELIAYLGKRIPVLRLLVLGTLRSSELLREGHPLHPILLEMQGHQTCRHMSLGLLTEDDVTSYLALEFPQHRFPARFATWVHRKTDGSPLFMADLLRYLVEEQALVRGAHWELVQPIEELEDRVPASVRSMIERKMETLSEEQRRLLSIASVQGETFDSLTLSEAAEIDELRLEDHLETLNRMHRLVQPLGEVELPEEVVTVRHKFVHVLYQNTLYEALTAKRRILLHARVGGILEQHSTPRLGSAAAELAQHFDRARQSKRALPYYLRAADNAVSRFAHVQGEAYCTRALELTARLEGEEQDRQRLAIFKVRGKIWLVMSRFELAVDDFEAMLGNAERLGDPAAQVDARYNLAQTLVWCKQDAEAEKQVDRILDVASAHKMEGPAAQARMVRGMLRVVHGHLDEALPLLQEAEEEARRSNLRALLAQAVTWHGELMFFRSHYHQAVRLLKQSEALSVEAHDGFSLLMSMFFFGLATANQGHLAAGSHKLDEGYSLADKNNDLFWLGRFPNCRAWIHQECFETRKALEMNQEAVTISRQTGFLEPEANAVINVGVAETQLGDLGRATESFLTAEEHFSRDDWFNWRYNLRLQLGWSELLLKEENMAGATEKAEACLKGAVKAGARKYEALAYRQLGRIALVEERIAEAEKHLTVAASLTRRMQAPLVEWRTYAAFGELYKATGRGDQARINFAAARQLLQSMAEHAPEAQGRSILASEQFRSL